jgi:hypothetical protein
MRSGDAAFDLEVAGVDPFLPAAGVGFVERHFLVFDN